MTVYKGPRFQETGILDIKTHIKKTNKQLYIHKTSHHPIAIGETQRYLRTKQLTMKWQTNEQINREYPAK